MHPISGPESRERMKTESDYSDKKQVEIDWEFGGTNCALAKLEAPNLCCIMGYITHVKPEETKSANKTKVGSMGHITHILHYVYE